MKKMDLHKDTQKKTLRLSRETVRKLSEDQLSQAQGGLRTDGSCVASCDPVSVRICPTSRIIC